MENILLEKGDKSIIVNNELIKQDHDSIIEKGIAILKKEFLLPAEVKSDEMIDGEPPRKKQKKTGANRNRPKQQRAPQSEKLCRSYWQGIPEAEEKPCLYEKCRFSHDVKLYLDNKPPDLGSSCHNYDTYGFCPFGVICRFGASHIESLASLSDKDKKENFTKNPPFLNHLKKEVQVSLWKRYYDFSLADAAISNLDKTVTSDGINGENAAESIIKLPDDKISNGDAVHLQVKDENCPKLGPVSDEDLIKLRPAEKKKILWRDQLYLAPLTTLGNLPFRRVCKTYGADITCGEMALAKNILQGQSSEWALMKKHESETCFGVQLCGNNHGVMTKCAVLMQDTIDIDFIDINMGCPIDLIFQQGSGSALMRRVNCLEKMVLGMTQVMRIPLTLKMRTGIHNKKNTAHQIIEKAKLWDVNMITIHGRTKEQRYSKTADWSYIDECAKTADSLPIFGGGDVFTYAEYEQRRRETQVAGIMIGRAALIKPWIFTEIKEKREWDISSSDRLDILRKFVNYGLEHWGSDTEGIERTRRFLLEWLSFLHRYIPVGLLERAQAMNLRPEPYFGRNDLETLMASSKVADWLKISEMLLGKVADDFEFLPKHKAKSWT